MGDSMGSIRHAVFLAAAAVMGAGVHVAPNPQEIIRKSVDAIKEDWAQAPKYSYLERDVDSKRNGVPMSRTYRVLMIDGSPYNLVTANNDEPLSAEERISEQRKLEKEMSRRPNESQHEREKRV